MELEKKFEFILCICVLKSCYIVRLSALSNFSANALKLRHGYFTSKSRIDWAISVILNVHSDTSIIYTERDLNSQRNCDSRIGCSTAQETNAHTNRTIDPQK